MTSKGSRILFLFPFLLLFSCAGSPFSSCKGWNYSAPESDSKALVIERVVIDRLTASASIQKECAELAALMLQEHGYTTPATGTPPRYTAEIHAYERELSRGWKNFRSLALTVYIRDIRNPQGPVAVGRISLSGQRSLASSRDLALLLSRSIDTAVHELRKNIRRTERRSEKS